MQIKKYGASADLLVINVEHCEGDFVRLGEILFLFYDCYLTFKNLLNQKYSQNSLSFLGH